MKQDIYVVVKNEHTGEAIHKLPVADAGLEVIFCRPKFGWIIGRADEEVTDEVVKKLAAMDFVQEVYSEKQLKKVLAMTPKAQVAAALSAAESESVSSD